MILFQFRMSTCQRLQSELPQFLPEHISSEEQVHDITTLKDMDMSLFQDFLNELNKLQNNECYKLWIERRILTNGKICFDLKFDVSFDNPEAFTETKTLETMKVVCAIFFDIVFKFARLKSIN